MPGAAKILSMTEDERQFLDENGYCILKDSIPAGLADRLSVAGPHYSAQVQ